MTVLSAKQRITGHIYSFQITLSLETLNSKPLDLKRQACKAQQDHSIISVENMNKGYFLKTW